MSLGYASIASSDISALAVSLNKVRTSFSVTSLVLALAEQPNKKVMSWCFTIPFHLEKSW
jgi:hypothetical protein